MKGMKNVILVSVLMGMGVLLWQGCCKESSTSSSQTDKVTFKYNGKEVTYGVIKRVYTKSFYNYGEVLDTPVVRYWMDRNLGAERVPTTMTDSLGLGHCFQYGRGPDGHQLPNSDTITQLSSTFIPGHNKFIAAVRWTLLSLDVRNNWRYNSGPLNPCPDGWRVANSIDMKLEMVTWPDISAKAAFASELKFPSSWMRYVPSLGEIRILKDRSYLWLGDHNYLELGTISQSKVNDAFYIGPGPGACVRCVKGE